MGTKKQPALLNDQEDRLPVIRREINIHSYAVVKGIMGSGVVDSLPLRVRCECSLPLCEEIIEVSLAKRRELRRSYSRGFIVVPDHTNSFQDTTLYQADAFSVVEKLEYTDEVEDL